MSIVPNHHRPKRMALDEFLPYRLSFASNLVSEAVAASYRSEFGVSIIEWRLIAVIAEKQVITQQEISERTRMDKVIVSRAASALLERGLIQRVPNTADKRSHFLRLTPTGRKLYEQVVPRALQLEGEIFSHFTTSELEQLMSMLRRIDSVLLPRARYEAKLVRRALPPPSR